MFVKLKVEDTALLLAYKKYAEADEVIVGTTYIS